MDPLWNNIFRKKLDEESLPYFLKHLPIFTELSPRALAQLEDIVHLRSYKAQETIFEEGDPGSGMYMIRSGSVSIYTKDENDSEYELARLGPGDFFGETTLTAPAPRSASAKAIEASELVGLFRADIIELIERRPSISSSILLGLTRVVSERLQASSLEIRRLQDLSGESISPKNVET